MKWNLMSINSICHKQGYTERRSVESSLGDRPWAPWCPNPRDAPGISYQKTLWKLLQNWNYQDSSQFCLWCLLYLLTDLEASKTLRVCCSVPAVCPMAVPMKLSIKSCPRIWSLWRAASWSAVAAAIIMFTSRRARTLGIWEAVF